MHRWCSTFAVEIGLLCSAGRRYFVDDLRRFRVLLCVAFRCGAGDSLWQLGFCALEGICAWLEVIGLNLLFLVSS